MHAEVHSVALTGIDAIPVRVEASLAGGLPGVYLVGLPDAAVREARERVRAALRAVGHTLPASRAVVNLAPADVRKEGPAFDLPIALALLAAQDKLPRGRLGGALVVGELGLDARVRAVPGVLAAALAAAGAGRRTLVVPAGQVDEARAVPGIEVVGVDTLEAAIAWARGAASVPAERESDTAPVGATVAAPVRDLRDVRGHHVAKRAVEIAAAGAHHLLLVGPPGTGKSMLAQRLPDLLPPLDDATRLEVARLHSLAGTPRPPSERRPPFRAPHHTASTAGLLGTPDALGELSLAHRGVLFLDELPEFDRRALEALREPLEVRSIDVVRARRRCRLPADVQLVAALNPCPCGHAGDPRRACRCLPTLRRRYLGRVSGPLLDRIALRVQVVEPRDGASGARAPGEGSSVVAARVAAARARALQRQGVANAALVGGALERVAAAPSAAAALLDGARRAGRLGERGADEVRRVARTIADLAGRERVSVDDVAEALAYRAELAAELE